MTAETAEVITPEQIVAQLRAEVASMRAEVEAFATDLRQLRLDLQESAAVDDGQNGSEAR